MREPTLKEFGLYSEEEARICLTCEQKVCRGSCDRLKRERERIHKESLPPPLYELETVEEATKADDAPVEFIMPDTTPWPKQKPYIHHEED